MPLPHPVQVRVIDPASGAAFGSHAGVDAAFTPTGADAASVVLKAAQIGDLLARAGGDWRLAVTDQARAVWVATGPPAVDGDQVTIEVARQKRGGK